MAAGPVEQLRAAEPTRSLVVSFAPAVVDPAWADTLPDARLVSADDDVQVFEVPAGLDLGCFARAALPATEPVSRFSFEPPDLSVVFRNAVDRSGTRTEVTS